MRRSGPEQFEYRPAASWPAASRLGTRVWVSAPSTSWHGQPSRGWRTCHFHADNVKLKVLYRCTLKRQRTPSAAAAGGLRFVRTPTGGTFNACARRVHGAGCCPRQPEESFGLTASVPNEAGRLEGCSTAPPATHPRPWHCVPATGMEEPVLTAANVCHTARPAGWRPSQDRRFRSQWSAASHLLP
jgi:hypothetical protein